MTNEAVCESPVAIAAPLIPILRGKTKSQSRKIFNSVLTIVETITNTGAPSFLPKPCNAAANADGMVNILYHSKYSLTISS